MISIENVSKKYGKMLANDNVSLQVENGELSVLLGPNGAGKSTLIKSTCGLLRFQGVIAIDGYPNTTEEAKQRLGYIPEFPALYPMLTVQEHLEFIARAYRLSDWQGRAEKLLERYELDDKKQKLGKELSKGMQQKVSICCAVLHQPTALILDEPLVGLDPHAIRELKIMMKELKQEGCSMIMSTHMIESVESDWDQTCIMQGGKIAKVCTREELDNGVDLENLYFSITENTKQEG